MIKEFIKKNWKYAILYIIFAITLLFTVSKKVNFHIDELLSYNLSNADEWFNPTDGVKYEPAGEIYSEYHTSNGTFDLSHVWLQQTNDVHPPFYYMILHGICCLTPNVFTMRSAFLVNFIFQILMFYVFRKLLKLIIDNDIVVSIISVTYIFNYAVLTMNTFFRMYIMASFFVTLFSYLILRNMDSFDIKKYIALYLTSVCGALTHYYFVVFIFFVSLMIGIYMIIGKRLKEIVGFIVTMSLAGISSYLIFPAIIDHVFSSGRGTEAIENLKTSNFSENLKNYYSITNKELFGGILSVLIFLIVFTLIVLFLNKEKDIVGFSKKNLWQYSTIILPCICFYMFIAKTAPYQEDRYISPIFTVLFALIAGLVYFSLIHFIKSTRAVNTLIIICSLLIVVLGLYKADWKYLYLDNADSLEFADAVGSEFDVICTYQYKNGLGPTLLEASKCRSITYYETTDYDEFVSLHGNEQYGDNVVFMLTNQTEEMQLSFINKFLGDNPDYVLVRDNGELWYTHSYYFSKN